VSPCPRFPNPLLELTRRAESDVELEAREQLFDRVEVESQRENEAQISQAFKRDASCQCVINEYEACYGDPMAIYATLFRRSVSWEPALASWFYSC
jgi:hypothetical protein